MNLFTDYSGKYKDLLNESIAELSQWNLEVATDSFLTRKILIIGLIAKTRQYTRILREITDEKDNPLTYNDKDIIAGYAYDLMHKYFDFEYPLGETVSPNSREIPTSINSKAISQSDSIVISHIYFFFQSYKAVVDDSILSKTNTGIPCSPNMYDDLSKCLTIMEQDKNYDSQFLESIYSNTEKYGRPNDLKKAKVIKNIWKQYLILGTV